MADEDGDLDEDDEEEDEDDEVDSEEQQRQGLISLENTTKKNNADEGSGDDDEIFKGNSSRSKCRKQGGKGMSPSSTSTATEKMVAAPVETKVKVENDLESSSNDVNDMCNEEEIELEVDV